ncbi:type 1 glutamine amidotransferase domain-containing protein [Tahibacter amnicola]|uniref:Type 1 glutamine amidotransferase domain-containing protein n=1 Tax=Tahibacter amnicola TaxID=2976241 RepID=A0ABY6B7I0_9GAMM|nr:type 1 glutamine amidotransferase domain-containing protein [Tahibacter amnicola]UXI65959.1 type 1 glutamine amidotransferase domain-containing protein [Tahibacter amnicola]
MKSLWKKILSLAIAPVFAAPLLAGAEMPDSKNATVTTPRVLVVVTNHADYPSRTDKTGLWLTELTHFWDEMTKAGVAMDIVSPRGGKAPLDERSLDKTYTDDAARAHLNDPAFMGRLAHTKAAADVDPKQYNAIYFTGGHGTMWDFRNAPALKRLAEAIHHQGGVVSAVCHGSAALIQLKGTDGEPLIRGKRVTGFSNDEENLAGVRDQVPFLLQDALQEAGATYSSGSEPFTPHAVTDGRLVTGQNPASSKAVAQQVLMLLRKPAVLPAK